MALKLEWGVKRTCFSCSTRFYDLRKMQPVCPKCASVLELAVPQKSRRGKNMESKELKIVVSDGFDLPMDDEADLLIGVNVDEDVLLEEDSLESDLNTLSNKIEDETN